VLILVDETVHRRHSMNTWWTLSVKMWKVLTIHRKMP